MRRGKPISAVKTVQMRFDQLAFCRNASSNAKGQDPESVAETRKGEAAKIELAVLQWCNPPTGEWLWIERKNANLSRH
jgi:hypothetical protein